MFYELLHRFAFPHLPFGKYLKKVTFTVFFSVETAVLGELAVRKPHHLSRVLVGINKVTRVVFVVDEHVETTMAFFPRVGVQFRKGSVAELAGFTRDEGATKKSPVLKSIRLSYKNLYNAILLIKSFC